MKSFFTSLFIFLALIFKAQTPLEVKDAENSMALVVNNQVFTSSVSALGTASRHFEIKNISANTITVTVRKYEDLINTVNISDKAAAYYCFDGICWSPSIITATYQVTAGSSFSFIPKLDEASVMGESNIRYRISSLGNDLYLTIKYNLPAGLSEINTAVSSLVVYPNPSNGTTFAEMISKTENEMVKLALYNSLGSLVESKDVILNKGKNTVSAGTENLEAGVYFLQIQKGNTRITKKITITN